MRLPPGSPEAGARIEVLGHTQLACCPKEHSFVVALLAEAERFIEQLASQTDPPVFRLDEKPAKLTSNAQQLQWSQ